MAERFDIHDERSFYLAGVRDLSKKIESIDSLRFLYKITRDMWLKDAAKRVEQKGEQENEDRWNHIT